MTAPCCTVPRMTPCAVPPPDLTNGSYLQVGIHDIQYSCNEEFWLSGPSILTCNTSADGMDVWLPDPGPQCFPFQDCPEIQLEHGAYYGHGCAPGDNVSFYCDDEERFKLWGASEATCLPSGEWSAPIPTCQDIYCKDPGDMENGHRRAALAGKWYNEDCCPPDTVMIYECSQGYELEGEQQIRCGENGTWTHRRPKCRPPGACDNFELEHGQVSGEMSGGEFFIPGDNAFVTCDRGFMVNGTDQLYCEEGGLWDDEVPSCVEYNCTRFEPGPQLQVDEFADPNKTGFPAETYINFRCDDGYLLSVNSVFSSVCRNGRWLGRRPKCEQIRCGALRSPEHGWMSGNSSTAVGSTVSFGCFQGYEFKGSKDRECESDGQWTGEPARCIPSALLDARQRNRCLDPGTPDNGRRLGRNSFLVGSRVTFICNTGYHMRGNDTLICQSNGNWSTELPRCIGKFYYDKSPVVRSAVNVVIKDIPKNNGSDDAADDATGRALALNGPDPERHFVYFLFDASTSIGPRNFRTGINLAKAITRKVNVTENGHRVGAIVFSKDASIVIDPIAVSDQDEVLRKLDNVSYTDGGTSINNALRLLKTSIGTVKNVFREKDREKKIMFAAFLITDGKANIGGDADKEARALKQTGNVEIYCIGITGGLSRQALTRLASKEENVFILRKYDSLQWLADELTNGTKDYGKCGLSYSHDTESGFDVDDMRATTRILGGKEVETIWPWMVEISLKNKTNEVSCGGTIIKRKWVLTAAHCTHLPKDENNFTVNDLRLRAGLIKRKSGGETLVVERIVVHEKYNRSSFLNDIALLELKKEIEYKPEVRPICLPPPKDDTKKTDFYKEGKSAFVIGWGKTEARSKSPNNLMQLKVQIGAHSKCNKTANTLKTPFRPELGQMCAVASGGDTCRGDSGGPLMQGVENEEKIWTQVGIVSWGRGKCKKGDHSFYTDVSQYMDWIQRHVGSGDAAAAAAGPRKPEASA